MSRETGARALQVLSVNDDHTFSLNEAALESILLRNELKDRSVVVVSVVGAFRKGKSFILSFFIRYLQSQGKCDWLDDEDSPLKGFHWRGGSTSDTKGILMWSEPFLVERSNGEKLAVILMDTQGTFDCESTMNESATVFAISTMISSVQVFNISQNIQEDDLQSLQTFTEYGKIAFDKAGETPFQKLQFLVRDWMSPEEHSFGSIGGKKLLDKRLKVSNTQHIELKMVRKGIRSCFAEISCCLMPHPGKKVSENINFDGRLKDIRPEFKDILNEFVKELLGSDNLLVKEIGGQTIKARELLIYFKKYMALFKEGKMPEIKTIVQATADGYNENAVSAAKDLYRCQMLKLFEDGKPLLKENELLDEHNKVKKAAMDRFEKMPKFGGIEFSEPFIPILDKGLEKLREEFVASNKTAWEKAEATNRSAVGGAVDMYRSGMEELFSVEGNFLLKEELLAEHEKLKIKSQEHFKQQPIFGGEDFSKPFISDMEQSIEKSYQVFVDRNNKVRETAEANNRSAIVYARDLYRGKMQDLFGDTKHLLKDEELKEHHSAIKCEAIDNFKAQKNIGDTDFSKPFLSQLEKDLEQLYPEFVAKNKSAKETVESNNRSAVASATEYYCSKMQELFGESKALNEEKLKAEHTAKKSEALEMFKKEPNIRSVEIFKHYLTILDQDIEKLYPDFVAQNTKARETTNAKSRVALASAKEFYSMRMDGLFGASKPLLTDAQLYEEHLKIKSASIDWFEQQSGIDNEESWKLICTELFKEIDQMYPYFAAEYKKVHITAQINQENAERSAKENYMKNILAYLFGDEKTIVNDADLHNKHNQIKDEVIEHYKKQAELLGADNSLQLRKDLEILYKDFVNYNIKLLALSTENYYLTLMAEAKKSYGAQMHCLSIDSISFSEPVLIAKHTQIKSQAVVILEKHPAIGDNEHQIYIERLGKELDEMYHEFEAQMKDIFENAEASSQYALNSAKELYQYKMEGLLCESKPLLKGDDALWKLHNKFKAEATHQLEQEPDSGRKIASPFLATLNQELDLLYLKFEKEYKKKLDSSAEVAYKEAVKSARKFYFDELYNWIVSKDRSVFLWRSICVETKTKALQHFEQECPTYSHSSCLKSKYIAELEMQIMNFHDKFMQIRSDDNTKSMIAAFNESLVACKYDLNRSCTIC